MESIKINHLKKEFGNLRLISVLTPDTFLRKMIVLSTLINTTKGGGKMETAIKQVSALNSLSIEDYNHGFKVLKRHDSILKALDYHIKKINELDFVDCESD